MKVLLLNGSPRKNWNTALMLKEAKKEMRERQFPLDLEKAFQMGTRLGR